MTLSDTGGRRDAVQQHTGRGLPYPKRRFPGLQKPRSNEQKADWGWENGGRHEG